MEKIIAKRLGRTTIGFNVGEKEVIDPTQKSLLLSKVEPEDFIQFGMIPEFIGRFNSIANCNELTQEDLISILTEPKNAIIKQFVAMFEMEGVKLTIIEEALHAIAKKAMEAGLYAANMPADVGGAGLDTLTWVLYERELGRASYALHWNCVFRPSNSRYREVFRSCTANVASA